MIPRLNIDGIEEADGWWFVWTPARPNGWQNVSQAWWNPETGRPEKVRALASNWTPIA